MISYMTDQATFKESLVLSVYDFILLLLKFTPKRLVPLVARCICFVGRGFVGRDIQILRQNLAQMRELPIGSEAARAFEKQTFFSHICSALETLKFSCNQDVLRIDGKKEFEALLAKHCDNGAGCIVVSAHLGSWESVGWAMSNLTQSNCYALARRPSCKALTRFFDKFRSRLGMKVMLSDRPLLLKEMVNALKKGGLLGVVMDQRPAGGRKTTVNFLGRETEFVCGPAIAARIADVPVYAVFCVRKGPMHYELISSEVVPAGHGIKDTNELTQKMATAIEGVVDQYPEQWTWHYDRWKNAAVCA